MCVCVWGGGGFGGCQEELKFKKKIEGGGGWVGGGSGWGGGSG